MYINLMFEYSKKYYHSDQNKRLKKNGIKSAVDFYYSSFIILLNITETIIIDNANKPKITYSP